MVNPISMNKTLIFSAVISATLMIATACKKEKAAPPEAPHGLDGTLFDNEALHLSDTVVKRGQTLTAGFADNSWTGEWTVEPNNGVKVLGQHQTVEILFTQPGLYTVTAQTANNGPVYTGIVRVTDEVYTQPLFSSPSALATDDTITLEPLAFPDDVLVFCARARKSYSCWPLLVYQNNTTSTAISIDFPGTPNTAAINCTPGPYPAPHSFVYTRGYTNGTHTITIRLGQALTAYTGTVTITDDRYIFNWPDNIPVVITPREINRVK
jgi:hypothetical protein